MTKFLKLAALTVCSVATLTGVAYAAADDYRFEPVAQEVRNGAGSDIAVRLIHVPTGKPVENAIIFRTRLDMSPDKMEAMTTTVEPAEESEPGVYRFRADFTMAGRWALKLMAKVQGEAETVQGTVTFKVKE
ncbi:MAG: FixH family protein [Hyphomicrobiaceae bacterium]